MAEYANQANLSGAGKYLNSVTANYGDAPIAPSCFVAVQSAADSVANMVCAIEALAEKLCGPVPNEAVKGNLNSGPGLFDAMQDAANNIHRAVAAGNAALDRIHSKLL